MKTVEVIPGVGSRTGRHTVLEPTSSSMKLLAFGTISLSSELTEIGFSTGECETALICVEGTAEVDADGLVTTLNRYDTIYLPRKSQVRVRSSDAAHLFEASAPVTGDYPLQIIRFAEVTSDETLHYTVGQPGCRREIYQLISERVRAGRLLVGLTRSEPGNWTSWPPHEHGATLEEIYVFVEMPSPAFGIQFLYEDEWNINSGALVREGDTALLPAGYHPNVALPGHRINFVWIMVAHQEVVGRRYGVVGVDPSFAPPPG